MTVKIGDTFQVEDKQWAIVDFDDINEQWVVENDGEREGVPGENLDEIMGWFKKAKDKPAPTDAEKVSASGNKNTQLGTNADQGGKSGNLHGTMQGQKKPIAGANQALADRLAGKMDKVPAKAKAASKPKNVKNTSKRSNIFDDYKEVEKTNEETEETPIMDEIEIGDIVVYEENEFLVIEFTEDGASAVLEGEDGEQVTAELAEMTLVETEFVDEDEVVVEDESEEAEDESEEIEEEAEELEELTAAGKTIEGKAKYNTAIMTAGVIKAMSSMSSGDAIEFFNKTMSQYGKGKDWGSGGKSGANKSSIDGKNPNPDSGTPGQMAGKVKAFQKELTREALDEVLEGEDLSEDFRNQAATLFEAAVNLRVATAEATMREELAAEAEESLAEFQANVEEQVDHYLSYVAENWVTENELAIESNLKSELAESLLSGMRSLLDEHYIDIPDSQVDVVEALTAKVEELESDLNEQIESNIGLCEAIEQFNAEDIFAECADGLALTQAEKFRTLTEGVEFSGDADDYRAKLEIIKEKYFQEATAPSTLDEEVVLDETTEKAEDQMNIDPQVARMAAAISRTVKR